MKQVDEIERAGRARRLKVIIGVVVVAFALTVVAGGLVKRGIDNKTEDLADDARRSVATLDYDEISTMYTESLGDEPFDLLHALAVSGHEPIIVQQLSNAYRAEYPVEHWGSHHCVAVVWTPDAVNVRTSGSDCE